LVQLRSFAHTGDGRRLATGVLYIEVRNSFRQGRIS
jgi:hypothetical protein